MSKKGMLQSELKKLKKRPTMSEKEQGLKEALKKIKQKIDEGTDKSMPQDLINLMGSYIDSEEVEQVVQEQKNKRIDEIEKELKELGGRGSARLVDVEAKKKAANKMISGNFKRWAKNFLGESYFNKVGEEKAIEDFKKIKNSYTKGSQDREYKKFKNTLQNDSDDEKEKRIMQRLQGITTEKPKASESSIEQKKAIIRQVVAEESKKTLTRGDLMNKAKQYIGDKLVPLVNSGEMTMNEFSELSGYITDQVIKQAPRRLKPSLQQKKKSDFKDDDEYDDLPDDDDDEELEKQKPKMPSRKPPSVPIEMKETEKPKREVAVIKKPRYQDVIKDMLTDYIDVRAGAEQVTDQMRDQNDYEEQQNIRIQNQIDKALNNNYNPVYESIKSTWKPIQEVLEYQLLDRESQQVREGKYSVPDREYKDIGVNNIGQETDIINQSILRDQLFDELRHRANEVGIGGNLENIMSQANNNILKEAVEELSEKANDYIDRNKEENNIFKTVSDFKDQYQDVGQDLLDKISNINDALGGNKSVSGVIDAVKKGKNIIGKWKNIEDPVIASMDPFRETESKDEGKYDPVRETISRRMSRDEIKEPLDRDDVKTDAEIMTRLKELSEYEPGQEKSYKRPEEVRLKQYWRAPGPYENWNADLLMKNTVNAYINDIEAYGQIESELLPPI